MIISTDATALTGAQSSSSARPKNLPQARRSKASRSATAARASLANCRLCAHSCGVNRLQGPAGLCHAGPDAKFFSAQIEVGDELELIPTFAIAFSGCDLRCDFCITGESSWNARAGGFLDVETLASRGRAAIRKGARTIMFLGGEPTIHLPAILDLAAAMPPDAKLIWKTNSHGSAAARELLDGIFDIWLADYKFGNDECAVRLAKIPTYSQTARENLRWAAGHSELIVRHLLMPGHLDCCWRPIGEWLAAELPGVKVSLRTGFWPAWQSARHTELRGTVAREESEAALQLGAQLGLNMIQ